MRAMEQVTSDAMLVRLIAAEFGLRVDNRIGILRAAVRRDGATQRADRLEEDLIALRVALEHMSERVAEIIDLDAPLKPFELPDLVIQIQRARESAERQLAEVAQIVDRRSGENLVEAVRRLIGRSGVHVNGETQ